MNGRLVAMRSTTLRLDSSKFPAELPDLAKENMGRPRNLNSQIITCHIPILKTIHYFIWKSNITGCPVFYLATLFPCQTLSLLSWCLCWGSNLESERDPTCLGPWLAVWSRAELLPQIRLQANNKFTHVVIGHWDSTIYLSLISRVKVYFDNHTILKQRNSFSSCHILTSRPQPTAQRDSEASCSSQGFYRKGNEFSTQEMTWPQSINYDRARIIYLAFCLSTWSSSYLTTVAFLTYFLFITK